jgi:hypothetical protein
VSDLTALGCQVVETLVEQATVSGPADRMPAAVAALHAGGFWILDGAERHGSFRIIAERPVRRADQKGGEP